MRTIEKNNSLTIAAETYTTARKLAKAQGMTVRGYLEKLIRDNNPGRTTRILSYLPDGTLEAHGEMGERIKALAARAGESVEEFVFRTIGDSLYGPRPPASQS